MNCIDELDGQESHQLISIKKFSRYLSSYKVHVENGVDDRKEVNYECD
jgi:hypothetical protein